MGQAEWMLVVTIGSLVGAAAMGINLTLAVWTASTPRPVPVTTWLGVMVLAASVLWARWDEDETGTIVAAVATAEPICVVSDTMVRVDTPAAGALLEGSWSGAGGCHIWAIIQDPRTGTLWVQGPASIAGPSWSLSISLATDDATSEHLTYRISIAAVDDETHDAWVGQVLSTGGIFSIATAANHSWLARDIAV